MLCISKIRIRFSWLLKTHKHMRKKTFVSIHGNYVPRICIKVHLYVPLTVVSLWIYGCLPWYSTGGGDRPQSRNNPSRPSTGSKDITVRPPTRSGSRPNSQESGRYTICSNNWIDQNQNRIGGQTQWPGCVIVPQWQGWLLPISITGLPGLDVIIYWSQSYSGNIPECRVNQ